MGTRCYFEALVIVLAVLAEACAPMSEDSLRTDPSRTRTFKTTLDYETVFKNEERGFLSCLTGSHYRLTFGIEPRFDFKKKTASIAYREYGGILAIWALVDIRGIEHGTEITANAASHEFMRDFPDIAQQWAEGNLVCPGHPTVIDQYPLSDRALPDG